MAWGQCSLSVTAMMPCLSPCQLFAVSQLAAVVLLFTAGLETDLKQFRRYAAPASLVAMGGVVLPFGLGVGATMLLKPAGLEGDTLLYAALFMGAVMTATSVGITARVLGDMFKLDSPEGVTIMAAAVVDDVLGILVLTVVVGIATPGEEPHGLRDSPDRRKGGGILAGADDRRHPRLQVHIPRLGIIQSFGCKRRPGNGARPAGIGFWRRASAWR